MGGTEAKLPKKSSDSVRSEEDASESVLAPRSTVVVVSQVLGDQHEEPLQLRLGFSNEPLLSAAHQSPQMILQRNLERKTG
ncbi:hypothetical protein D623_10019440 [Myotis brandtii]|uniref:Uncharacterized protein n=1 Tax=Myotis brandtii TaxID=109478 RepID=S7PGI5_MYOBR|nr:hypothetical protein D623_10019440 [Myotis brandtii]